MKKYPKTDFSAGLTSEQVAQRVEKGEVNTAAAPLTKTIRQILSANLFTLFNAVNLIVFALVLTTGRYINTLFMGVIISNTLIGIIQEIKAKNIIDKLSIISALHIVVLRDGKEQKIPIDQIVLDDICILSAGDQVSADGDVVTSNNLETDESLLTGESEPVLKDAGDKVLSGSFVLSGRGVVRITGVGNESYAQQITSEAKRHKRARSEILETLNKIIKTLTFFIVPVGILLFLSQYFRSHISWQDAVVATSAGIIGMIPEGLIVLTSIGFAAGMIKLARRKTIVQDLAGIEVLAHVNILCLDKTGTLTEGTLEVSNVMSFEGTDPQFVSQVISAIVAASEDKNSTSLALAEYFKQSSDWAALKIVPFSSSRKWSGAQFEGQGSFVIGAPEFVFKDSFSEVKSKANEFAAQGYRVMALAESSEPFSPEGLPKGMKPLALILLSDRIRAEAKATLEFFADNDVEIKVISGDNPVTVSHIARQLSLKNAERFIDATTLPDEGEALSKAAAYYTVFGRVTPKQKRQLIAALKSQDNIVAMVGDGVNDVLALREADCGIAMASGSDAARGISQIVLLDSNFISLPGVVMEGRQVINNIERVACLYLTKTIFSVLLSVFFIITGLIYPLVPFHITLIGVVTIGVPSFFLTLEQNKKRVEPGFLKKIIVTSLPGGIAVALNIILLQILQKPMSIEPSQLRLISVLLTTAICFQVLIRLIRPFNINRVLLLLSMIILFITALIAVPGKMLQLPDPSFNSLLMFAILGVLSYPLMAILTRIFASFYRRGQ